MGRLSGLECRRTSSHRMDVLLLILHDITGRGGVLLQRLKQNKDVGSCCARLSNLHALTAAGWASKAERLSRWPGGLSEVIGGNTEAPGSDRPKLRRQRAGNSQAGQLREGLILDLFEGVAVENPTVGGPVQIIPKSLCHSVDNNLLRLSFSFFLGGAGDLVAVSTPNERGGRGLHSLEPSWLRGTAWSR